MNRFTTFLHVLVEKESDIGTYYCSGCGKNFSFELRSTGPRKLIFEAVNFSTNINLVRKIIAYILYSTCTCKVNGTKYSTVCV